MRIALKVDTDTFRGTIEGIPALLDLFDKYQVKATFLFSLGPDHTGRAIRRIFRTGFLSKVQRTSVVGHYGLKTLLYGVVLPGPDIAKKAGHVMRAARNRGHEVGIHCYDHVRWQDFVAGKGLDWTRRELDRANEAFLQVFQCRATTHGAAGWQLNPWVLQLEEMMGFEYASDTRGQNPFLPSMNGVDSSCVQIPTTLPTLDELIGVDGITAENVNKTVFKASRDYLENGHVYTLHAELEGMKLLPVLERLLQNWLEAGDDLVTLNSLYKDLDPDRLPRKKIIMGSIRGRSGLLGLEENSTGLK